MDKRSASKKKAVQEQLSSSDDQEGKQKFVDETKKRAKVKTHGIDNAATFEHPASFQATTGRPDKASLRDFINECDIEVLELNEEEIVFDLIGAEPPLANALRRILIAEIPTIAIEKVNMWQNTSIIPDENLAHRVGLVPIKADAREFEFHPPLSQAEVEEGVDATTKYSSEDCIKFKLHVRCTKKDPKAPMVINNTVDEEKFYNNANVYASQLKWEPIGDQKRRYPTPESEPKALFGDILIAKLRPGQEIEMELFCEKGIGKTHAKWSPVSTAYYRLVPDIRFKRDITGEDAKELKRLCPVGVFDIEDIGGTKKAVVGDARKCTTCRECIRPAKFQDIVDLGKQKDRFEFHVETVGQYRPEELVVEALKKLKEKATHWLEVLEQESATGADEGK